MPARVCSNRRRPAQPGSSTDSDSDSGSEASVSPRRRPFLTSSTSTDAEKKKKKKKRLPPQESIDKIWQKFSQPRFSKAMTVLPFAPVAPSPLSGRANELLSCGYERAAEECRRKVHKIIQECRRVNARYRDPGWDIDWDLKVGRGNCLNSLVKIKFDVSSRSLKNASSVVPKAVKRVHEIFERPTFLKDISGSDIKQGTLGDCWFISSASGLANVPGGIERSCVAYDTKIGIYGFVFFRDGEWIYSIIDDRLYLTSPSWDSPSVQRDLLQQIDREDVERVYRKTYQTGSKALFFAKNKDQNETWLPLMEKAYAKAHGDYVSLTGGWTGEGIEDLTGGVTTELLLSDVFDTENFWTNEISRVNDEFFFGCSTGLLDGGTGERDGIKELHAYSIVEARTLKNGTRLVKMRNPWGKVKRGTWMGAWSDGAKEWTPEVQAELGHSFSSDSVFWISYEDFLLKFQHIDRTRLFREPDWRCCQRWIAVDVPWRSAYNEKFQITLAKESPIVVVLSQLDTRYFDGLVGQYCFRLHFRLHHQGCPDAEDYIVRSHGNFLMNRSVSVDLPVLEAGTYSVFLAVEAWRDHKLTSVEDVVKNELQEREENEKLSQVGQAYDLAHCKAAAHMKELALLRKKQDQAKASAERQSERHKAWAKRHLLKDIQRRQKARNDEKKSQKRAAKAEKRKGEEAQNKSREDKESQTEPAAETAAKDETTETAVVESDTMSTSSIGTPISTPLDTPRSGSIAATPAEDMDPFESVPAPPIAQAPAAKQRGESKTETPPTSHQNSEDDISDSSDSPIEDWEEFYSSDDMSTKATRQAATPPVAKEEEESDDEKDPAPWNAICVVGIRVYSKDEDLELRVVMEGGSLSENGMGEKGEPDLDNAQVNAGGMRAKESAENEGKTKTEKSDKETKTDEEMKAQKIDEKTKNTVRETNETTETGNQTRGEDKTGDKIKGETQDK